MSDEELRKAIDATRLRISNVGSMHSMWDVIHAAEAILAGKPSVIGRAAVERLISKFLRT
jgi:hypothetical protein